METNKILKEIRAVNEQTDQRTVKNLHNRLMLYNTLDEANREVLELARQKGIIL